MEKTSKPNVFYFVKNGNYWTILVRLCNMVISRDKEKYKGHIKELLLFPLSYCLYKFFLTFCFINNVLNVSSRNDTQNKILFT